MVLHPAHQTGKEFELRSFGPADVDELLMSGGCYVSDSTGWLDQEVDEKTHTPPVVLR
jgi:hypothetical protein